MRAKQNQALNRIHFILRIRRKSLNEEFRTFDDEPLTYQNWDYGYPFNLTHGAFQIYCPINIVLANILISNLSFPFGSKCDKNAIWW